MISPNSCSSKLAISVVETLSDVNTLSNFRYYSNPFWKEEMKNSRIRRRVYELLCKAASSSAPKPEPGQRELHFVFFRKPDRFLDSEERRGHIAAIHLEKTTLLGKQRAVGTGEFEDIECGLLLKSIGYRSKPVDGLPFDHEKGVVPNLGGRVIKAMKGDEMAPEVGLDVCGWLKRGPTGIVATNLFSSEETVANIMEDLEQGELASASSLPKAGREGLLELLEQRNCKVVTFEGWEKIDEEEQDRGALKNKPGEKLTTMEELLHNEMPKGKHQHALFVPMIKVWRNGERFKSRALL